MKQTRLDTFLLNKNFKERLNESSETSINESKSEFVQPVTPPPLTHKTIDNSLDNSAISVSSTKCELSQTSCLNDTNLSMVSAHVDENESQVLIESDMEASKANELSSIETEAKKEKILEESDSSKTLVKQLVETNAVLVVQEQANVENIIVKPVNNNLKITETVNAVQTAPFVAPTIIASESQTNIPSAIVEEPIKIHSNHTVPTIMVPMATHLAVPQVSIPDTYQTVKQQQFQQQYSVPPPNYFANNVNSYNTNANGVNNYQFYQQHQQIYTPNNQMQTYNTSQTNYQQAYVQPVYNNYIQPNQVPTNQAMLAQQQPGLAFQPTNGYPTQAFNQYNTTNPVNAMYQQPVYSNNYYPNNYSQQFNTQQQQPSYNQFGGYYNQQYNQYQQQVPARPSSVLQSDSNIAVATTSFTPPKALMHQMQPTYATLTPMQGGSPPTNASITRSTGFPLNQQPPPQQQYQTMQPVSSNMYTYSTAQSQSQKYYNNGSYYSN